MYQLKHKRIITKMKLLHLKINDVCGKVEQQKNFNELHKENSQQVSLLVFVKNTR